MVDTLKAESTRVVTPRASTTTRGYGYSGTKSGAASGKAEIIEFGTAGALALGRLLSGLLFEVGNGDPATLLTVAATVGAVTVAAALAPAWRAASADPLSVLRSE